MSTYSPALGPRTTLRRSGSLSQVLNWQLHRFGQWLERVGQHRAAPEIARAAERLALTHPQIAADLAQQAKAWREA